MIFGCARLGLYILEVCFFLIGSGSEKKTVIVVVIPDNKCTITMTMMMAVVSLRNSFVINAINASAF